MSTARDLRRLDRSRPLVGASVLSADFGRLGDEARSALSAGADFLHIDVMDGHFVPNLSMGPEVCKGLRRAVPGAIQDVHLMVDEPLRYAPRFREGGADHITLHAEVIAPGTAAGAAEELRRLGVTCGISVKPKTPLEPWLGVLGLFDMVLVMSVEPGFSGQAFIEGTSARVRTVRAAVGPACMVAVDGGVSPVTARGVIAAGADVMVAASAIYAAPESGRAAVVSGLRG